MADFTRPQSLGDAVPVLPPVVSSTLPSVPSAGPSEPVPIFLMDHQLEHGTRVVEEMLPQHIGIVDTTETGGGKSFICMRTALYYGLRLLVVCPSTLRDQWRELTTIHGVPLVACLSYRELCGTKKSGVSHGFLNRVDSDTGVSFVPTPLFEDLINGRDLVQTPEGPTMSGRGVLVVFDECQKGKNGRSLTSIAMCALTRLIASINQSSRVMALSASPFDKPEHAFSLIKMIGLNRKPLLHPDGSLVADVDGKPVYEFFDTLYTYNRSTRQYTLTGYDAVLWWANLFDPEVASTVYIEQMNKKSIDKACYELYERVIKRFVSSACDPVEHEFDLDARSYFAQVDPESLWYLEESEKKLRRFAGFRFEDDGTGTVKMDSGSMGRINLALQGLERAKLPTLVRLTLTQLEADPMCKVLVYVTNKSSVNYLYENLSSRGVPCATLNGDTKQKDRKAIIDKYQEDSGELRVIIASHTVGGEGHSLDDQHGNRERYTFAVPNYYFINLYQLCGRTDRAKTKSQPHVYFIYSSRVTSETAVLDALVRKSSTARGALATGERIVFPGEFNEYNEPETVDPIVPGLALPEWGDLFPTLFMDEPAVPAVATLGPASSSSLPQAEY